MQVYDSVLLHCVYYTVFSNGEQCEEITSEVSKHVADVLVQ